MWHDRCRETLYMMGLLWLDCQGVENFPCGSCVCSMHHCVTFIKELWTLMLRCSGMLQVNAGCVDFALN